MLKAALLGYGYAGRVFHAPLIASTPGLALTVVASSQPDRVRERHPHVEVVADPAAAIRHPGVDLVVIATPNASHAPLADAALAAGRHVVVDKPFTVTLAEARTLAAHAARAGRVLSVFQNRRWDSDFLALRQAAAASPVGEIVELRSEIGRYRPEVRDRWRERDGPGAGLWYDLGPHLVDQALVLFGPPDTVSADLQMQRGGTAVDWFHVVLGYGARRVILTSSMLAADAPVRFLARGTRGSLIKCGGDVQERQLVDGVAPGGPGWGRDPDPLIVVSGGEARREERPAPAGDYPAYYAAIRDAIRGERDNPVTPAQATTVMAVIEAGLSSSSQGRVVRPGYTIEDRAAWVAASAIERSSR